MASLTVGEFHTRALDSRTWVRAGVLRKAVKRRFRWRFGKERSCLEEGIGNSGNGPSFYSREENFLFTLLAVGVETV